MEPEEEVWAGLLGAVVGGLTEAWEETAEGGVWGGAWEAGCRFAAAAAGHPKYETLSWRQVQDPEAHLEEKVGRGLSF